MPQNHSGLWGAQGFSCVTSVKQAYAIQALCQEGQMDKALDVILHMEQQGSFFPSVSMYNSLLKACAERRALAQARVVHEHLRKLGMETHWHLGELMVSTLVKCGGPEDALQLFDRLPYRTALSWTALISGCTSAGQVREALIMYHGMVEEGLKPNKYTFASLLKASGSMCNLVEGKQIHAEAVKYGYESDLFVGTCLVDMYVKCGSIVDAQNVFHGLPHRDVVSWTAMLAAYAQQGEGAQALQLYELMREEGVSPNDWTFSSMLQACGALAEKENHVTVDGQSTKVKSLVIGKALHADAQRKGYHSQVFVGSTLISLYGKCRCIVDAQLVFGGLSKRNVVSWNAMLAAFVQEGQPNEALQLYGQMEEASVTPDLRTFVSVLQACGTLGDTSAHTSEVAECLGKGKAIHADICRRGCDPDVFVGSSLISMYGKCGSIEDAEIVFEGLSERNVVSWNGMLVAYVEQGHAHKALQLYGQMQEKGIVPSEVTHMCALRACSNTGSLSMCRQIHNTVLSMFRGNDINLHLANTLIYTYGKCGSVVDAQTLFDSLEQPSVVSWTALIAGYAREGNCAASMQCYEEMLVGRTKPNAVTFLSVLSACNHAGLVDKGVQYLESMSRDCGLAPDMEHYSCVIGLLGRAGCFSMAEHLLSTMPMKPDLAMWLCLLAACRNHGNLVLGRRAFEHAVLLHPKNPSAYMLMWNMYADAGLWDCADEVKELRQRAGALKKPGQSWIQHGQEVYSFVVGGHKQEQHVPLHDFVGKVNYLI